VAAGVCDDVACYHPLVAYRRRDGTILFVDRGDGDEILLPCGRCIGCRLERSRQWAARCVQEASMHDENCFITLTYDDEHLPPGGCLRYPDFQKFMKRLRKHFAGQSISFFMCGEYGETTHRAHYHACLFGVGFRDAVSHARTGSDNFIFTSEVLSKLWPFGFASVAEFNFRTAAYVARYIMKKVTGDMAESHYTVVDRETGEVFVRPAEFCQASRNPAVGRRWYEKYGESDVEVRDACIVNGVECSVPRYYDKLLRRRDRVKYNEIKCKRELDNYRARYDNTDKRLGDKETVAKARVKFLKRGL